MKIFINNVINNALWNIFHKALLIELLYYGWNYLNWLTVVLNSRGKKCFANIENIEVRFPGKQYYTNITLQ